MNYKTADFGDNVGLLDSVPLIEQGFVNTYLVSPDPLVPNPDTLDTDDFSRYYTIQSVIDEAPTSEAMEFIIGMSEYLSKKGFKYRYGCNEKDAVATSVFNAVPKGKEVYKPYEKFAPHIEKNLIDVTATFASQAVTAAVYNRYSKELGFKPSSGFKQAEEEIMRDESLSAVEQQMKIAKRKAELSKVKRESAVFSTLPPGRRSMRSTFSKQIFGGEDMNVPVKFIVIHSSQKHIKIADLDMESKANLIMPLAFSEYFGIPIFNIANEEGRTALKELVKKITGGVPE